jgi:uncharacterized protein (TIGR03435 family)
MRRTLVLAAFALPLLAQPNPTVEVASVKRSAPNGGPPYLDFKGNLFTMRGIPIRLLLGTFYGVQFYQISGAPNWLGTEGYDIEARSSQELTAENVNLFAQSLLEDRFQLKVHFEKKDGPVFALVVGKGGAKLKRSANQTRSKFADLPVSQAFTHPLPEAGESLEHGAVAMARGVLRATGIELNQLQKPLTTPLGRPVINRTSLVGLYDVELTWAANPMLAALAPDAPLPDETTLGPSIFTAVQEQLGLKLESSTGPIEYFVIDRVERPSEN